MGARKPHAVSVWEQNPTFACMEWHEEQHPDWYHDIPVMDVLILGSFPPHRGKWTYPFYYPNAQNRFWRVLARLAGHELSPAKEKSAKTGQERQTIADRAVWERQAVMETLRAGVQNLGLSIRRKGKSSLDTDIEITRFQDIAGIIRKHPELKRILLPGYSAKNSTFHGFRRYLAEQDVAFPDIKPAPEATFTVNMEGRTLECVILNSTSTATQIPESTILEQFRSRIFLP